MFDDFLYNEVGYDRLSLIISGLFIDMALGQDIDPNGYNVFYYANGNKSSEGTMVNGKPDGYWKTYYSNTILKYTITFLN